MGESQVPYTYDEDTISALKASLSEPRFSTYLAKAKGNETFAIALYLYNTRLAKAFLFPLGVTEVVLRNAVDDALVNAYGACWHLDSNFRDKILTSQSLDSLDTAIGRADSEERDRVVAELTFDYWSNLFRNEYGDLWRTNAITAFPELQEGMRRGKIQKLVREINRFRNRVAHHEPILDENAGDLQSKMVKLTGMRCPKTSEWMRHHTTINIVMSSKPNLKGSAPVTLLDKSDPRFQMVEPNTTLYDIASNETKNMSAFVCSDKGMVIGAFTHAQLSHFISDRALDGGGILDLNDLKVADVINNDIVRKGCRILPANTPIFDTVEALKEQQIRVVVAIDNESKESLGVILRAHRRY